MKLWWLTLWVLVLGCAKPRGPMVSVGDPEVVVALARSRPMMDAMNGRFSLTVNTGEREVTVPLSMLLDHPDRFRIELYSPFGTPLMTATSNGTALHVWSQRDRVFYAGHEASAVLKRITGGEVGIDDFLAILTGKLPLVDAEILHIGRTVFDDDGVVIVMLGPDEIRVRAVIDPKSGLVRQMRVDPPSEQAGYEEPKGDPILQVTYEGQIRQEKVLLPASILVEMPRIGWVVQMNAKRWGALSEVPEVFDLTAPPSATIKDLRKTLEEMALQ
jgi:hypothetical protein